MEQKVVEQKAREIKSWLEDAVGDAANDIIKYPDDDWHGKKSKIMKAKRQGVADLSGWLADELYNEVSTICDLIGDRVYDSSRSNPADAIAILNKIKEHGHSALVAACDQLIKTWKERL